MAEGSSPEGCWDKPSDSVEKSPSASLGSMSGSYWNIQSQFGFPSWPPAYAGYSGGCEAMEIEV